MASKDKPKPKLRDLSTRLPSDDELDALHAAFFEGSPIVAAILGQAMVEIELDRYLRRKMTRKEDDVWTELVDDRGPFATFSAKITAGYALGLYDEYTREYLDQIRRIRNAFAHSKTVIDFDNDLVAKEIRRAKFPPQKKSERYKDIKYIRHPKTSNREAFLALCYVGYAGLIRPAIKASKRKTAYQKRKFRDMQRSNPLVFGLIGSQAASAGLGAAQWLLPTHTADPNSSALQGLLGTIAHSLPQKPSSGGDDPNKL
jgi:hypothetical protein